MQFANAVKFFPFVNTIKNYSFKKFQADVLAALIVAIVALPQSMAYALIAGIHPKYGLYAVVIPTIISSLFGSSRHVISGATNTISMLVASTLSSVVIAGTVIVDLPESQKIGLLFLLAFLVGIIQLIMGVARFGKLINFVSFSVITGYTAGVGVLIAFGQLRNLLGLSLPNYRHFVETVFYTFHYSMDTNIIAVILGVFTIVFILLSKKLSSKIPAAFLAMMLSAIAVRLFHLDAYGVKLVGDIPRSLPPFSTFPFGYEAIRSLFIPALAIALLTAVEALSIAKSISHASGEKIDSRQEFFAQGLANISAAFSSSMPGSGSFTRSVVNYSAGAASRFAGVFSGIFVLLIIVAFAPYAKYIPMPSLAGILMVIAYSLVNKKGLWLSFKSTRADRWVLYVTIASTLLLDLDKAVYVGVLLSIILYLRYVSRPPVVKMVPMIPNGKLAPYKEGMLDCSEVAIYQIEGSLFFGAIEELEERLASIDYRNLQVIILRMKQVRLIDATAIHALDKFLRDCEQKKIAVIFAGVRSGVLRVFTRSKLLNLIGSENIVKDTNVAVKLAYDKYVSKERCVACTRHVFAECREMARKQS